MAGWVQVWNETRGLCLLTQVQRCTSFGCRLRGLMFRRRLRPQEGMWLVGKRKSRLDTAIHMLFVFFPIAVVWLDAQGLVVDTALARPFRPLYVPRRAARDVLEAPLNILEHLQVGDQLSFRS